MELNESACCSKSDLEAEKNSIILSGGKANGAEASSRHFNNLTGIGYYLSMESK